MSKAKQVTTTTAEPSIENNSRDVVLEVLSNKRRRFVIHFLKQRGSESVTVSELAEQVAGWEYNKEIEALTHRERKRVRNALRQFHLPKMAECGFIEFDPQRGTVSLTESASNTEFYIDSLTGRKLPWGVYYLGLSALSAICLVGLWLNVSAFGSLAPLAFSVFFVTTLTVSSLGHFYDNYYRMRLGAGSKPTEVENP